ncbi:MAG TPA: lipopolysaccharide biosynthesis protein [Chryseolinea sp.]|nr:lipopolysaccharide biosynthesis protein [Chryseolinea sp.]
MVSKSFLKSSLIYTLAGMLPMASAVILLPLYIHNLSTAAYGALAAYMVFTLLVQIIVTFSFDTSVYIHFHELKNDKEKLNVFISSAFVFMILLSIATALVLSLTGSFLFKEVFAERNISFYPYGLASVGSGVFQALFRVHSTLLQSREKPETFFWSNVLSFSLVAICIIIGFEIYPNSLAGPIIGRLIGSIIPAVWALSRIFREFGFHWDFGWLKSSLAFNTYNFIYQLQQWVINQFDRVLMIFFLTLSDVGVYDFALKCLIPVELLMNSLHNSFYPKIVTAVMDQSKKGSTPGINRYYHGLTAVVMLLICGSILTLPWAIKIFVNRPDYHEAIRYIPYLGIVYLFRCTRLFFTVPYGILKYTKPLPVIYMIVSGLKIVLIFLLVGLMNIYGVILASVISAVVEVIMVKLSLRHVFDFQFNVVKVIVIPSALLLLIVILEPTLGLLYPNLVHVFYLISCVGLLWWAYRNEITLINPFNSKQGKTGNS